MTTLLRTTCFILSVVAVSSCAFLRPATPERLVKVKLVVDRRVRESNVSWRSHISRKFRAAADFFDDEFGIRLAVEGIHPWTPEEPVTSTGDLLKLLKAQVRLTDGRESFDLIVGFTQLPGRVMPGHARVDEIGNCATGLGNYIALAVADTRGYGDDGQLRGDTDVQSLIHEIGHIFGAEHVEDRDSIMAVYFKPYSDFDKKNRDVISKNKFCAFRRG